MDHMVGALAIFTLGIAIIVVGLFYLRSLREGRNMDAAKNVLKEDGSSAHTAVRAVALPST